MPDLDRYDDYDSYESSKASLSLQSGGYQQQYEAFDDDTDTGDGTGVKKKKGSFSFKLIAVQSISCIVIVIIVLLLRVLGGNMFDQVKSSFNDLIMENSVVSTIASWFDAKPKDLESSGDKEKSENSEKEQETSKTDQNKESEKEQETSSTTGTDKSGEQFSAVSEQDKSVDKKLGEVTPVLLTLNDSNNDDFDDVRVTGGRIIFAPKGATFAPIRINVSATLPLETGRVSSGYGYRINPFNIEEEEFHKGIDIAAEEGTPISSVYFGAVSSVGSGGSHGNYVVMDHGNGLKTLYAHCLKVLVKKGDIIKSGETIAQVGTTGRSTGNHLHFEVMLNDINYDPTYIVDTVKIINPDANAE